MRRVRAQRGAMVVDNGSMVVKPFNLSRWFALVGLVAVASISVVAAAMLSRFLTERMQRQEAVLTMEFIQTLVLTENAVDHFRDGGGGAKGMDDAFVHVAGMPDVLRASAHNRDRTVIWSNDASIVGRRFTDNPELEEALAGELVVHGGRIGDSERNKEEHASLSRELGYFVEIYFPVRAADGQVVGAIELYKTPRALFEAIQAGERAVWAGAGLAGLFLYLTLFWRIRAADRVLREQGDKMVQSETLAAVGEMGLAVAHGIRNPLAAIRSSAELNLETTDPQSRESAQDIIAEVDRVESWVRELLSYARPVTGQANSVDLAVLLGECLAEFEREAARRGIAIDRQIPRDLPPVRFDPLLLGQVTGNLVANACEAIGHGGRISVRAEAADRSVRLAVEDDGPGLGPEELARVFTPFYTTKARGMGLGLPLTRRILERFGGSITVDSAPGRGTRVELVLPAAP